MNNTKNIDYILDSVIARGFDKKPSDCNDFALLLHRKDFKDLIALELYESYFWEERHEFDIQILKEIVEAVSVFFSDPDTIMQIKSGLLQTLPSTIIVALVAYISGKTSKLFEKNKETDVEDSGWHRVEVNIKKIDNEFSGHDYILTDEIENVFDASREEVQPLLKLCGCKCYVDKKHRKRSIWVKAGLSDSRVKKILKEHHFKIKR